MEMVDAHINKEEDQKCTTKIVQNHLVERLDSTRTEKSQYSTRTEKSRLDSVKSGRLDSVKSGRLDSSKSCFDLPEMIDDDEDFHIQFDENAIVLIRSKLDSVKIEIQE